MKNNIQQGGFSPLGFTLIEIMIGIIIASSIIIIGFQAFNAILVGKVKLIESTNIEKISFSFSQKFFEEIKKGGELDYEEYFNRKVVGNTSFTGGHFDLETGFGNNGTETGFYYCRSNDGTKMTGTGCVTNFNNATFSNQNGKKQRYGQYSFQFIDYNNNYDSDLGDEDGDSNIIGDDDDEFLGTGPKVFTSGTGVTELYLISADKKKRTFFRWNVINDPNAPPSSSCNSSDGGKTFTGSGCLGTIQFLKLDGKDWGFSHNKTGSGLYDGVIDTWIINKDFVENTGDSGNKFSGDKYWVNLFPNSINVKLFEILVYPNKNIKQAWKESGIDVSPYVRIKMILTPSWKIKKRIKGKVPEFNISTTVNLTDIFSR